MDITVMARLIPSWLLVAGVLAAPGGMAQSLADPTRPPDAPLAGPDGAASAANTASAAPQLQSVLVSSSGRRVAVINGQTVRVGDKVGNASVAGIDGNSVLLRRGKALETLRLYPKAAGQGNAEKKQVYATQ